jgi:hypothetical protein
LAFFYSCWELLKKDVMNIFHECHARGKFEKCLDASFIALIPKNVGGWILTIFTILVL